MRIFIMILQLFFYTFYHILRAHKLLIIRWLNNIFYMRKFDMCMIYFIISSIIYIKYDVVDFTHIKYLRKLSFSYIY